MSGLATSWPVAIAYVEFAINSAASATTGKAPFALAYGSNVRLPIDLALGTPSEDAANAPEFIAHVQDTVRQAQDAMARAQEYQKRYYD